MRSIASWAQAFLNQPMKSACAKNLQSVVSRNLDPTQGAVVSVCRIHGGDATNVIPDCVALAGTIRAFLPEVFDLLMRRIKELAVHTAQGFGCQAETTFTEVHPSVMNDAAATAFALGVADSVAGGGRVLRMDAPVLASEDFSFYGRVVPSCFSFIGMIPPERKDYPGLHSPQFDFTDAALDMGIKLMCNYALAS